MEFAQFPSDDSPDPTTGFLRFTHTCAAIIAIRTNTPPRIRKSLAQPTHNILNRFRQVASYHLWAALDRWHNRICRVLAQRQTVPGPLWRLWDRAGANQSARWEVDIAAVDNRTQAGIPGRAQQNRIVRRQSSTEARNPPSRLVPSQEPPPRPDPAEHKNRGGAVPGSGSIAWRPLELQLQDREVRRVARARRGSYRSGQPQFQVSCASKKSWKSLASRCCAAMISYQRLDCDAFTAMSSSACNENPSINPSHSPFIPILGA